MIKAIIIGAGQTGRGYTARLLREKKSLYDITFIDQDRPLIDLLNEDACFSVHFYEKDRSPVRVDDYGALCVSDSGVDDAVRSADFIFTAVGEQNLRSVAELLKPGLMKKSKPTAIVTFENGVNPANVLQNHFEQLKIHAIEPIHISQTAIFCSTVHIVETRLDLLSQNENYVPYDADRLPLPLEINGAIPTRAFEKFFERKIYTYNCLAGVVSYFGYVKGYSVYSEAANDPEIAALMDELLIDLDPALAKYFEIALPDQQAFSQKALAKFRNPQILDYVIKNGRAAKRKLGPTERIAAPIRIIEANGGNADILYFNAAAALCYWDDLAGNGSEPMPEISVMNEFCKLLHLSARDSAFRKVEHYYNLIQAQRGCPKLREIIRTPISAETKKRPTRKVLSASRVGLCAVMGRLGNRRHSRFIAVRSFIERR